MALNALKKFWNVRLSAKGEPIALGGDIASITPAGIVDVQESANDIDLADGKVLIGGSAGVAVAQDVSGDVTITHSGVTAIGAKKVLNTMILAEAGTILVGTKTTEQVTKLDISAAGALPIGQGAGETAVAHALSGDVTMSSGGVTAIGAGKVTYAMIQNTAAGFKVIGKPDTAAGSVSEIVMAADQVLAKSGTGNVSGQKVLPAMTDNIPIGLNFGVPAANVANRYVVEVDMKVGTYTVANSGLPGDSMCHNVTVTHSTQGGTADTLGTIDIVGTDYNDAALTETITPVADSVASGTKAFKSITSVTGVNWAIDTGGTPDADHITVGFGGLIGLPVILGAAADLVMATHGTGVLNAPTVAVGAAIGQCTIDLTTVGDGAKRLRLFYQN